MPNVIGTLFHKEIPYGGVKGDKGDTGATPNVSATASVNSSTGTPSVNVVKTGTAENPSFEFAFSNLKGEKGDPGSGSSVDWGDIDGTLSDQTDLSTELAKKYDENDTAETDIDDADYFPFYDTSDTGKRKSLWSNIKAKLKAYFDTLYLAKSHVGMVIHSTTLDTEAKVKAVYGGTTWVQLSGYMLRGASSGVTPNQNLNDGGADSVTVSSVASHNHTQNSHNHTQNAHAHAAQKAGNANGSFANGTGAAGVDTKSGASHVYWGFAGGYIFNNTQNATATNIAATATNQANGANYSVNTLPKYKNVYIWERTA